MLSKSKLALVVAVAATTLAAPAFAQAVDHTGTLFASHYGVDGKQVMGTWTPGPTASNHSPAAAQTRGLYSYARVPAPVEAAPQFAPGASSGYDGSIASQR